MSSATGARFQLRDDFRRELTARAAAYFRDAHLRRRDNAGQYAKTAVILFWFVSSWALLVFGGFGWAVCIGLAVSLALAIAAIGFNIQHDANHGSYSRNRWVNRLLGYSLDMVGGSSYVWRFKHNVFHHSFANIAGADADISAEPLVRMAPAQKRRAHHRQQSRYIWVLYGLLPLGWELMDDFRDVIRGRIGTQEFPRPKPVELAILVAWKFFFFAWALAIPMLFHPVGWVIVWFVLVNAMLGIVLSTTFQLAHCVDEVEFPEAAPGGALPYGWAEHQVRTSSDFSRGNALVTWYVGGLNYQIEHHLFPRVSHCHYPALAKIVEQACAEFGVPYRSHPTVRAAIRSHVRLLRRLGA